MLVVAGKAPAQSEFAAAVQVDYDRSLAALFDDFHRHPELSFMETRTAARIANELRAAGAIVTKGVGGTGVVGVMRNGEGPVVLVRADMDGLPIQEASGLPNMSTVRQTGPDGMETPVMHACGHDVHVTALIGAARQLAAIRNRWRGTVLFVAQPAEERGGGARAMLADGLYTRFPKPDYALAFHVAADFPTGMLDIQPGLVASSSDSVNIIVHGVGAHGAYPHEGKDPIVMGSEIVMALQTLVSREVSPLTPAVVTVGAFQSGTKPNIIPDRATLQLTIRSNDPAVRRALLAGVKRIAENVGRMNGIPDHRLPEVKVSEDDATPPTMNDPALAARVRAAFVGAFGADAILPPVPPTGMGAEDFAYFVQPELGVRGAYFYVGGTPKGVFDDARAGGPPVPSHHSPQFRVDPEASVRLGVEAMTIAVLDLLKHQAGAAPGGE